MSQVFKSEFVFFFHFILGFFIGCSGGTFIGSQYEGGLSGRSNKQSIIFVGDTQRTSVWERLLLREQNDGARQAVLNYIGEENPGVLVILGDLVSDGSNEEEWQQFDEFLSPIIKKQIPLYPVLGNHDYFGNNDRALENFFARFPHLQNRSWSTFSFQSIGIVLLNSNFDELTSEQIQAQSDWLNNTLDEYQKNDSINAIIVTCHHPPFTNSRIVSDDAQVVEYFVKPFLRTPKAKLFLTGHCHSYEHFKKEGKDFIVTGGGGGPRQAVETNPSKQKHRDVFQGKEIREFHFCKVSIEERQLKIQMTMIDDSLTQWSTGDEFTIQH